MSKNTGFDKFWEDFLIFAASKQNGTQLQAVGAFWVAQSHFPNVPDAWRVEVLQMLERKGLGQSVNTGDDQEFYISGEGISEANRILGARSVWGKTKIWFYSNWLAVLAVVISIIALFK